LRLIIIGWMNYLIKILANDREEINKGREVSYQDSDW
jgi:hypothetical protein